MMKKYFKIYESKSLQENAIFWISTITPIVISIALGLPIILNGLNFDFSAEGYTFFLNEFKFPLWISSSSLILGVMVGRFHGSAQRAATLKATKEQNNFSNYLNHRDHFQKYMQNVSDEFDLKVDAFRMYGILFSESTPEQVMIKLSVNVTNFLESAFESHFWSKMKNSSKTQPYQMEEVNTYFPRFAREIGINAEKLTLNNYADLKAVLIKIREIYRRAMDYGFNRTNQASSAEIEESAISQLIGEFDSWAVKNSFKEAWHNPNNGFF